MIKNRITDLYLLYASLTVRKFAVSLFGVFVPIYLLNLNYSIKYIALFFVVFSALKLVSTPVAIHIIARLKTRLAMSIAYTWTVLFIISLLSLPHTKAAFYLAAISMGLMHAFLYVTTHVKVSRLFQLSKGTQQVAQLKIFDRFAGLFGPFIGGILSTQVSIAFTLVVALLFLAIAWILLWSVHLNDPVFKHRIKPIAPLKDVIANFNFNIAANMDEVLWPLYIALFLVTYQAVGTITAFAFCGAIAATYMTGKIGDKGKNKKLLLGSTVISAVFNLVRPMVTTVGPISAISLLKETAGGVAGTSWTGIYYTHTRNNQGQVSYVYAMELAGNVALLLLWLVLLGTALLYPIKTVLTIAFVIAAFANVFINLISSDR